MRSQRFLNSTVPFQSDSKALNCLSSNPASHTESKGGGELDKMIPLNYILNVMNHGTAKHEWRHGTEKHSIIAQAECKYWFKETETMRWSFPKKYLGSIVSVFFHRWVPGFTGVLPQWQVKAYVTVTQTHVSLCFILISGLNISLQLTYIFSHKNGPRALSSISPAGSVYHSRSRRKRHKRQRRRQDEKDSQSSEFMGVTGVQEQDSGECLSSSLIQVRLN